MNTQSLQPESFMSAAEALPTIRDAVAMCYYVRLKVLNGGPWYQNEQYKIRLELTPDLIGLAIQNNIEAALIGKYGAEQGVINAAEMLNGMLDEKMVYQAQLGLTEFGISLMNEMFKSLAEMAYEALSQGQPITANMDHPIH